MKEHISRKPRASSAPPPKKSQPLQLHSAPQEENHHPGIPTDLSKISAYPPNVTPPPPPSISPIQMQLMAVNRQRSASLPPPGFVQAKVTVNPSLETGTVQRASKNEQESSSGKNKNDAPTAVERIKLLKQSLQEYENNNEFIKLVGDILEQFYQDNIEAAPKAIEFLKPYIKNLPLVEETLNKYKNISKAAEIMQFFTPYLNNEKTLQLAKETLEQYKDVTKAKEVTEFLKSYIDKNALSLAKETLNKYKDISKAAEIMQFFTPYLNDESTLQLAKEILEQYKDVTKAKEVTEFLKSYIDRNALSLAKETLNKYKNITQAAEIMQFFTPYLNDEKTLQLAKEILEQSQGVTKTAEEKMQFLLSYINNEKALLLAKETLDKYQEVTKSQEIMTFLLSYISEEKTLFLAKDNLEKYGEVNKAKDVTEFLKTYIDNTNALEIAQTEFKKAEGDIDKAQIQMNIWHKYNYDYNLRKPAEGMAEDIAEKELTDKKNNLEKSRDKEIKNAKEDVPKSQLKNKNGNKYQNFLKKEKTLKDNYNKNVEKAQQDKEQKKNEIVDSFGDLVQSLPPELGVDAVNWFAEHTRDNINLASSLKEMMLVQANKQSRILAEKVLNTDNPIQLAQECTTLLAEGVVEDEALLVGKFITGIHLQNVKNWICEQAQTQNIDTLKQQIEYLTQNSKNLSNAFLAISTLGLGYKLSDFGDLIKQKPADVKLLLNYHQSSLFNKLVSCVQNKKSIDILDQIINFNNNNQKYAEDTLGKWLTSKAPPQLLNALQKTTYETCEKFVENVLSWNCENEAKEKLYLVRLQSLLEEGNPPNIDVYRQDRRYQGVDHKRTGFLRCQFANNDVGEIHTHWETDKMKILSMHFKINANDNGLEINTWNYFGLVQQAVLNAHNNSANYPPTSSTPNSKLKL